MNFQYITIAKRLYPNIKTFRAILYLELKIKCKICCAILQGPIELSTYTIWLIWLSSEISKVKKECSQGGSVVNALLATGLYKIRALTRNPNSDKAKALKAKGVDEVVKCDLSNKEDIKNALSGADIAWILIIGVNPGEEERQGKLIADAAKEVGFNWLIYSFLPDSTTESDGKYPAIINLSGISAPFVDKGNEVERMMQFMIDVESDTGPIVAKIIEEGPAKWNGKKVPVAAESVGLKHLADVLTKDYGLFGKDNELKDISIAKKLHPKIKSFEQYAIETYPKA
ncbi:10831_t:CDS:2 [Rhizophagus irregularis]|nr:10831_t:CDS:2 [Rhizophagus irregularis]